MEALKLLVGSLAVYAAVACGSAVADRAGGAVAVDGQAGAGGAVAAAGSPAAGAAEPTSGGRRGRALAGFAGLLDPVPDAGAQEAAGAAGGPSVGTGGQTQTVCDCPEPEPYVPPEPEVVTVPCDQQLEGPSPGAGQYYAVASFPDAAPEQLATMRAFATYAGTNPVLAADGFPNLQLTVAFDAAGDVAVACGSYAAGQSVRADSVTFILH